MSVSTLMPAATQDTKEVIAEVPVLTDYHMNTGYDWMEEIEEEGWAVIPSWGVDGWDLGEWPYVMVAGIRTNDDKGPIWGMATYCEGDVKTTWYRTQAAHWAAISEQAHFHWMNRPASSPKGLPDTAAEMSAALSQPFPGWLH